MFDEENKTESCKKVKSHKKSHFGHLQSQIQKWGNSFHLYWRYQSSLLLCIKSIFHIYLEI